MLKVSNMMLNYQHYRYSEHYTYHRTRSTVQCATDNKILFLL